MITGCLFSSVPFERSGAHVSVRLARRAIKNAVEDGLVAPGRPVVPSFQGAPVESPVNEPVVVEDGCAKD